MPKYHELYAIGAKHTHPAAGEYFYTRAGAYYACAVGAIALGSELHDNPTPVDDDLLAQCDIGARVSPLSHQYDLENVYQALVWYFDTRPNLGQVRAYVLGAAERVMQMHKSNQFLEFLFVLNDNYYRDTHARVPCRRSLVKLILKILDI